MNTRILGLTTALALSFGAGAMAQTTAEPQAAVAAAAVGHWLYDAQGNSIGSVRGLADGGQTAVLEIGTYFRPGSHEQRVPVSAVSMVNGKATLGGDTVEALNTSRR